MVLIDCISIIVFYVSIFYLMEANQELLEDKAKIGLWLFWLFIFPPIKSLFGTDLLALSFYITGVCLLITALQKKDYYFYPIVSGILIGWCAFIRNAYWAVLFMPSCGALLALLHSERRDHLRIVLTHFLCVLALFMTLAYWRVSTLGSLTYLSTWEHFSQNKSIYWDNLWNFRLFPLDIFGWAGTWFGLKNHFPFIYYVGQRGVALGLFLTFLFQSTKMYIKGPLQKRVFTSVGFFTVGSTLLLLTTLSLRYYSCAPHSTLTHVQVPRFFAPTYPFIALMVFQYAFSWPMRKTISIILFFIFIIQTPLVFTRSQDLIKNIKNYDWNTSIVKANADKGAMAAFLREAKHPRYRTVLIQDKKDTDWLWVEIARYMGILSVGWEEGIAPQVDTPTQCVVVWPKPKEGAPASPMADYFSGLETVKLGEITHTQNRQLYEVHQIGFYNK